MDNNSDNEFEPNDKKKVLIVYHTGSGSTRTICEILKERLSHHFNVELSSIFQCDNYSLDAYDFIIFGFPTYHCHPSLSMMEFVKNLTPSKVKKNAVVLTTYGLYPGNSIRLLVKELLRKNIVTIDYSSIRGPASDGVLMFPSWVSFMFKYEKYALNKIKSLIQTIKKHLDVADTQRTIKIPRYKWYVPLNNIISFFGERNYSRLKKSLSIDREKCTNCGFCIRACGRRCWINSNLSINKAYHEINPSFDHTNCEFCLRCVHNCPVQAIMFNIKMSKMPRLDEIFYNNLKNRLND